MLEYIFTERSVRWRINWYNEVKVPMLIAGILFDNGRNSLEERVDNLRLIATKSLSPPLPGDKLEMTAEEEFVQIALRSRKVHARAKLVIMQILNQIGQKEKRASKCEATVVDYSSVSVTKIFEEMLSTLKDESPEVVQ